jgi:hypothetical protein
MTLHYHGTPITPARALLQLTGRCFCVSHARPDQVRQVHSIGQSVLLDNGAYSKWREKLRKMEQARISGCIEASVVDGEIQIDWSSYYDWCEEWLGYPTTWAIIPDVIDGGSQLQDALVREWPFGHRGAPVWHMDEPLHRLLALCDAWPKVCIGSTAEYRVVLSDPWRRRMDECWNALAGRHRHMPWVHMLRGMQCSGMGWPFASVDSTDIAQNHNRPQNTPRAMADRWDAAQCPGAWQPRPEQLELVA